MAEHDREFPWQQPSAKKLIYKIDLAKATNINDFEGVTENADLSATLTQDEQLGLLINGVTLEQLIAEDEKNWQLLAKLGIHPVEKTLAVDVLATIDYPHDKLEGIWLRQDGSIGLLNDDDFAMNDSDKGVEHKYLDADKTVIDGNRLYVVVPKV